MNKRHPTDPATTPTLIQTFVSVAASFFGVQSSRNRERDFTHGNPWHFILLGLAMTAIVALIFYGAVHLALRMAGQ